MADRYWVGGTGAWNSTTKWSTTSGGASGASVPTSSDNAIFDANSGASHYTVTVTDNSTCADLTFTPVAINGMTQFSVGLNFVIAGTFSTSGTQGNRRALFRSSTYGLTRDMQIATIGTVTDVDFRDIRVTGTGGTLTGTRIGDHRGNSGITFSTPKTVYWVTAGGGNWSADNWATSSGGAASTDNFPLAQDTAVIENTGLNTSATVTLDAAIVDLSGIDMSSRTNAMTILNASAPRIYGDLKAGSGVTFSSSNALTFFGRNTQTITSAGRTIGWDIYANTFGGTLELADALNIGARTLGVDHGTFDTKGYNVTAGQLSSNNSNVREIKLGASTLTFSGTNTVDFGTPTNLTFDAGTSSIVGTASFPTLSGNGQVFYDVSFTNTGSGTTSLSPSNAQNVNSFNSLSITAPSSAGLRQVSLNGNQTITGTLTATGASAVRRVMLRSSAVGTTRTLTVGTLSADDCDFRDITIAGTAAGGSPTRAGDCGGNSGVTFPAAKTVYWNLAGTQDWSADGWATSSGGSPAVNNFPLAQDTAVFDDTGSAGTVNLNQNFNVGTVDMSARTTAMTIQLIRLAIYGDLSIGTGITTASIASPPFSFNGQGTSTITSNGVEIRSSLTIDCGTGTVQLADALELNSGRTLTLTSGTFDAVSYNVTAGNFAANIITAGSTTLKMGSGLWTMIGTGNVWNVISSLTLYKGTADILLSSTSTNARTFRGGTSLSYNKLTIGGATGTSTLTFSDNNNSFTELASTKTVAHTIALGTTAQTFGKWSVTGTSGNVVTLTGTGTNHILAGSCTDGIDYLAMGSIGFAATSPAEFYAGANSTGTAAVPVYRTAKPADSTRYWVGGTGNWNDTNMWSTSSGGAGGADLPRSHDDVVFDSSSNATAYTATVNAITGGNRCKALTIAGPASGNVTLAGSTALYIHDDITLPATGLTRTYTGGITLSGSTSGKTITTNGVTLASAITVNGVGAEWALADALSFGSGNFTVLNGSFDTAGYNLTGGALVSNGTSSTTVALGASTLSILNSVNFGASESSRASLMFIAGTSQINLTANSTLTGNNQTFYNVSFTSTSGFTATINGANTFNNLSLAGRTGVGISNIFLSADQTINGTLTLSAGTNATMRTFVQSNPIGTTRTLTCAAVDTLTDIDFRDITIAGAAVSGGDLTGTRLGDCKGNSGITFDAAKTVYYIGVGGGSWGSTGGWSFTSGGASDATAVPLAQDTAVIDNAKLTSGSTVTINAGYNIGTIDMSARTTNTMTLANANNLSVYGNWINGTGVTISGSATWTFAGRGSQTITSAGIPFTQSFSFDTPSGSVTLQDAFETSRNTSSAVTLRSGIFDANGYNVTLSGATSGVNLDDTTTTRTLAVGSGTWTIAGSTGGAWDANPATNLTVTGTGTIRLTASGTKTFNGGGLDYSGITLDQGGAGTLTLTGNNTLKDITNSYSATGSTTINFGNTTQRLGAFSATGTAGNVLTVQGTSATTPCTLVFTGTGIAANVDYLTITGVRAYPTADAWYAGTNSTNNGSLGWLFEAGTPSIIQNVYWGSDNTLSFYFGSTPVTSIYYGSTKVWG